MINLIFLKISSLKSLGWTWWLVSICCDLFCSFWRLTFYLLPCLVVAVQPCIEWIPTKKNLPVFQTYRNHPSNLQWHNAGKNTCGRVSFLLAYYRCFLAFCPCELLGWFLYNGNIGKYKANILVSYISPRVSHNGRVWGENPPPPPHQNRCPPMEYSLAEKQPYFPLKSGAFFLEMIPRKKNWKLSTILVFQS